MCKDFQACNNSQNFSTSNPLAMCIKVGCWHFSFCEHCQYFVHRKKPSNYMTHILCPWTSLWLCKKYPNTGKYASEKTPLFGLLLCSVWKVSKYGVFSAPYFPLFGLNTEIYGVNLCTQSEYEKIWTRKTSVSWYIPSYTMYKFTP